MPTLGNHLDFKNLEARQMAVHNLTAAPSSPVKGQLWFNTTPGVNELYYFDGTIWQSAKSGAGSSGPPSGPAGGSLTGSYPNPTIAPLAITDAMVAAANKDGSASVPSMRTIGFATGKVMSGGATLNIISSNNLADSSVSFNGQKLIDLGTPSAATDGATKGYVDGKTPSDATTGVKGIVQLAGDLAGTAASPQIAAGVITDAEVATANKDGAVGTASMRTLGAGAQQAMRGNIPLDDITPPDGFLSMNGYQISNLAAPALANDAANKQYVDNAAQGLDAKASVRVATTVNFASLNGVGTVIDSVTLTTGDRVLVKDQTTQAQNGIYTYNAGALSRATDFDAWSDVPGAYVWVEAGATNADTGWVSTADQGGTLGTTAVTWTQFASAGQITGGAGLTKTGNTLNVGAGNGIDVQADTVGIGNEAIVDSMIAAGNLDPNKLMSAVPIAKGGTAGTTAVAARTNLVATGRFSTASHAAGATITYTAAQHLMANHRGLIVQVLDEATGNVELPDITISAGGDVTVTFAASVAANSKRVTIIGGY
jgi:Repeat of unknown function (DUF5907)